MFTATMRGRALGAATTGAGVVCWVACVVGDAVAAAGVDEREGFGFGVCANATRADGDGA